MRNIISMFVVLFLGVTLKAQTGSLEWHSLFNGKDLSSWMIPEDNQWWTIQDGKLIGENDPGLKGSVLWTKNKYRDFIIQLDFKFGDGTVDSGIFLRNINEQIQLGISGKYKRDMTCSPYIGSKGDYPVEAKNIKQLLKPKEWNHIKVMADGNRYVVWLNGQQVLDYLSDSAAEKGPIGLQVHPNKPMEIEFMNIQCAVIQ